jgi:hypothetical protein
MPDGTIYKVTSEAPFIPVPWWLWMLLAYAAYDVLKG